MNPQSVENLRVGREGTEPDTLPPAEPSDIICHCANIIADEALWPEDIVAVLDALREGILKDRANVESHKTIAQELACLADFIAKELT